MQISILNFNTLGTPFYARNIRLRYKKICEIIKKEQPDIVCLQEVATYFHLFLLKKYLPYPYYSYKKAFQGPKGGLVIFSKIPLHTTLYKTFSTLGGLKDISLWSRIIQNGMLITNLNDIPVTIINTHTFTDFEFEWSPQNRFYRYVKAQVEQIASEVNKQKQQYILLTGDYNMKKNSTLYKFLVKQTKVIDIFHTFSSPTYFKDRLDYKFAGKSSERIDFIFLKNHKKKIGVLSREELFTKEVLLANKKKSYLSDHIGLKAVIKL